MFLMRLTCQILSAAYLRPQRAVRDDSVVSHQCRGYPSLEVVGMGGVTGHSGGGHVHTAGEQTLMRRPASPCMNDKGPDECM